MDFPENVATNVIKTEGILFIQWAVYSIESVQCDQAAPSHPIPHDANHSDVFWGGPEWRDLHDAEFALRRSGQHVLHDKDQHILWMFDVPAPTSNQNFKHDDQLKIDSIVARFRLSKKGFGSVRASDLNVTISSNAQRLGTENERSLYKPESQKWESANSKSFLANARINQPSLDCESPNKNGPNIYSSRSAQNDSIYLKICAAISKSICFSLAATGCCTPLSRGSLVYRAPKTLSDAFYREADNLSGIPTLTLLSLEVHWSYRGTMTIIGYPELAPKLQSFSDLLPGPPRMTPLRLSTGLAGQFYGMEKTSDTSFESLKLQWKADVIGYLAHQGINLPCDTRWIEVQRQNSVGEPNRKDRSPYKSGNNHTLLWPAPLCFVDASNDYRCVEETLSLDQEIGNFDVNVMTNAEAWFLDKGSRNEAIATKLHDKGLEVHQGGNSSSSEGEDFLSGPLPRADRYTDPQTISGIYPTPPDGYRSQAATVPDRAGQDASSERHGEILSDVSDADHLDPSTTNPPSPRSPSLRFDAETLNNPEVDLFGELDTDMFTANALTEADFNFFDEAGEGAEHRVDDVQDFMNMDAIGESQDHSSVVGPQQSIRENADEALQSVNLSSPYTDLKMQDEEIDHRSTSPFEVVNAAANENVLASPSSVVTQHFTDNIDRSLIISRTKLGLSDLTDPKVSDLRRRGLFGSVSFKNALLEFDRKYVTQGRFATKLSDDIQGSKPSENLAKDLVVPKLGLPLNDVGIETDAHEDLDASSDGIMSSDERDGREANYDSIDPFDQDGERSVYYDEIEMGSGLLYSNEDNHGQSNELYHKDENDPEAPTTSPTRDSLADPSIYCFDANLSFPSLKTLLLDSDVGGPLTQLFHSSKAPNSIGEIGMLRGKDGKFIEIAQMLTAQIMMQAEVQPGTQRRDSWTKTALSCEEDQSLRLLLKTVEKIFPFIKQCSLNACGSGSEDPFSSKAFSKSGPRPSLKGHDNIRENNNDRSHVIRIPAPHVNVRRGEMVMNLDSTSLAFWEELGLGPLPGPKSIKAFCLYPGREGLRSGIELFFDAMSNTYQSCKLGDHASGVSSSVYPDGHVQLTPSCLTNQESFLLCMRDVCSKLARSLARTKPSASATLIYLINPFEGLTIYPRICLEFHNFINIFHSASHDLYPGSSHDMVLKIIPLRFLVSKTGLVIPRPAEYKLLAFEMYDRCRLLGKSPQESLRLNAPPSFQLAEAIPKAVEFALTSVTSPGLLISQRSFHLAYSWNLGDEWLTISSTDNLGNHQWNASYCLGKEDLEMWAAFKNVAKDIWDTLHETLNIANMCGRLFLGKAGFMTQGEINAWTWLVASSDTPLNLVLVTINSTPPLRFPRVGPANNSSMNVSESSANIVFATPVSTPQATSFPESLTSIPSPGSKPGATSNSKIVDSVYESTPHAKLLNAKDETWGVRAEHCCVLGENGTNHDQANSNGYLVKRISARDEDGLIALGLRIVQATKFDDVLLNEVFCSYSFLGTLAKARGIVDPINSLLPLHVAAARKAQSLLSVTMQYDVG